MWPAKAGLVFFQGDLWDVKKGEKIMKEKKDCQLKFRLTKKLNERIAAYCEQYDLSVSEFIRRAIEAYLRNKED